MRSAFPVTDHGEPPSIISSAVTMSRWIPRGSSSVEVNRSHPRFSTWKVTSLVRWAWMMSGYDAGLLPLERQYLIGPSFPIPSMIQPLEVQGSIFPTTLASVAHVRHTYPEREGLTKTAEIAFDVSSRSSSFSLAYSPG